MFHLFILKEKTMGYLTYLKTSGIFKNYLGIFRDFAVE